MQFEVITLNPLPIEVIAAMQDERNGTLTKIEYLTVEQILEKYGEMLPANSINALLGKTGED